MKHYLLTPVGLKRILNQDVAKWQLQGGFMKAEGSVLVPVALGQPDADCIEGLLKLAENFVYWFTPDYRAAFTTKEARAHAERAWKIRFEVRGMSKNGKACTQTARVDGKVYAHNVIKVIAEVFTSWGKQHGAAAATSDLPVVGDLSVADASALAPAAREQVESAAVAEVPA